MVGDKHNPTLFEIRQSFNDSIILKIFVLLSGSGGPSCALDAFKIQWAET